MSHTILVASSSEYRRWWYEHNLTREGFAVRVAADAMECVNQIRREPPHVLILETPLHWGGADYVLDAQALDLAKSETRILLVTVVTDAGEMYRVGRYAVDDVLSRAELERRLIDRVQRLVDSGSRVVSPQT